jgi:hypothetical protein
LQSTRRAILIEPASTAKNFAISGAGPIFPLKSPFFGQIILHFFKREKNIQLRVTFTRFDVSSIQQRFFSTQDYGKFYQLHSGFYPSPASGGAKNTDLVLQPAGNGLG